MREMGWTWGELQATPAYVQRFCWDLSQIRHQAEARANEQAAKGTGGGGG